METNFNTTQLILNIENKFPVSEWSINGIDVWPILRVKLQTKINQEIVTNLSRKPSFYGTKINQSILFRIKKTFTSYFKFYALPRADFIATSNFSHLSVHQNKIYNKFYDPIFDNVNSNGLTIEHNTKYYPSQKQFHNNRTPLYFEDFSAYLDDYFAFIKKIRLYNPLKKVHLKNYDLFLDELKNIKEITDLEVDFQLKNLSALIHKTVVYSKVYKRILRRTKPAYTFQICHYNINSLALSVASKQLNIPSVEIQHGAQPQRHLAYGNWTNVPNTGYNTLPKIFWNWDKESNDNLKNWTKSCEFHHALLLGNPWVDYLKNQLNNQEKKYILFSLQPIKMDLLFPDYLINYIINNPQIIWWMRIHPTDVNRKSDYIEFFEKHQIDHLIVFDDGEKLSLPETLMKALVHITYSSGVVIEADLFGITSLILDEKVGGTMFNSYIEAGKAFLINESNFKSVLKESLEKDFSIQNKPAKTYLDCFKELDSLKD